MAAKSIEQKLNKGEYSSPAAARLSITRSRMHGKMKKRLLKQVDEWEAGLQIEGENMVKVFEREDPIIPNLPTIPPILRESISAYPKLDENSRFGKLGVGASHVGTSYLDRAAMLLLVHAVNNKCSMTEALSQLASKINSIGIDG